MKEEVNSLYHTPVLLNEVIAGLGVLKGSWYIDATIGGGGHTEAILNKGGNVIGIDQDIDALDFVKGKLKTYLDEKRLRLYKRNFSELREGLGSEDIKGIVMDLGMSTYQIRNSAKGFSFLRDETLDMRMSGSGMSAADIVNTYSLKDLKRIFAKYGEELFAEQIAVAICRERADKPITQTQELAEIVKSVYKKRYRKSKTHPATRIFQALRIEVNHELEHLKRGLSESLFKLSPGGKLIVISFHSLEDRIVKLFFNEQERQNKAKIMTKKPLTATASETAINNSARSAKLRILEKL